jgi:hypothetical protein
MPQQSDIPVFLLSIGLSVGLLVRFFVALFIHIGIDFIGKLNIVALLIALTITLIITS